MNLKGPWSGLRQAALFLATAIMCALVYRLCPIQWLATPLMAVLPNTIYFFLVGASSGGGPAAHRMQLIEMVVVWVLLNLAIGGVVAADQSEDKWFSVAFAAASPNAAYHMLSQMRGEEARLQRPLKISERLMLGVRVPPYALFALIFAAVIGFANFLQDLSLDNLGTAGVLNLKQLTDAQFANLQVYVAGGIAFGTILPVVALLALLVGYQPRPVSFWQVALAAALTLGAMSASAVIGAVGSGWSAPQAILAQGAPPEVARALSGLWIVIIIACGLLVVVAASGWAWLWARLGNFLFRHHYL